MHLRIDDGLHALDPALGAIVEANEVLGTESDVPLLHRRDAVRLVLFRIRLAPDAEEPSVEQARRAGEHPFSRQAIGSEVADYALAQARKAAANSSIRSNFSRSRRARQRS
jgi:hypothetical protein